MAGDGMRVDYEVLRDEGRSFQTIGRDFAAASKALEDGLTLLEKGDTPPWGDDEVGEKFGIAYEGLRDGMFESMRHLGTELQRIGKALQSMAGNQDLNEDFNEAMLDQEVRNAQENSQAIVKMRSPSV